MKRMRAKSRRNWRTFGVDGETDLAEEKSGEEDAGDAELDAADADGAEEKADGDGEGEDREPGGDGVVGEASLR